MPFNLIASVIFKQDDPHHIVLKESFFFSSFKSAHALDSTSDL